MPLARLTLISTLLCGSTDRKNATIHDSFKRMYKNEYCVNPHSVLISHRTS